MNVQEIIMAVYDEGFKAGIKYAERTSNEQPSREIFQSSLHTGREDHKDSSRD